MPTRVIEFDAIDSTNAEAQRRAVQGERGPLWLRADQQIVGRGRSGRAWSSPSGNLSASFLFAPACQPDKLHQLSLLAGVAAHDTIVAALSATSATAPVVLKWPNDVMIDGAKVGGILVESSTIAGDTVAVIGCGVNIAVAPDVSDRAVTALAAHGMRETPAQFLARLDVNMLDWLHRWSAGAGFAAVRTAWLQRSYPLGEHISVNANAGLVQGSFAGLDEDGALLVQDSTRSVRRFHFGDVIVGGDGATHPKHPE